MNIDHETKLCISCRKEVDRLALVCSYCRGDVSYSHHVQVDHSAVIHATSKQRDLIVRGGIVLLSLCAWGIGLAGGGLLVGLGAGIIAMGVLFNIAESAQLFGTDKLEIVCPSCHEKSIRFWPINTLSPGKTGNYTCPKCKNLIAISIDVG